MISSDCKIAAPSRTEVDAEYCIYPTLAPAATAVAPGPCGKKSDCIEHVANCDVRTHHLFPSCFIPGLPLISKLSHFPGPSDGALFYVPAAAHVYGYRAGGTYGNLSNCMET